VYCDNRPRYRFLFRHDFLEKFFQGFPSATTQVSGEFSIIEEISGENLWYAEDEVKGNSGLARVSGLSDYDFE